MAEGGNRGLWSSRNSLWCSWEFVPVFLRLGFLAHSTLFFSSVFIGGTYYSLRFCLWLYVVTSALPRATAWEGQRRQREGPLEGRRCGLPSLRGCLGKWMLARVSHQAPALHTHCRPRVWASLTSCASLGKSLRLPRGLFLV